MLSILRKISDLVFNSQPDNNYPVSQRVDIVVYLHSDLIHVKECLEAIVKNSNDYNLIIINDDLDHKIADYLTSFSLLHHCSVIENLDPLGFARSVNKAIKATFSRYLVVLDSRVIVTKNWLEIMLEALSEDATTGMVAPLSDGDLSGRFNDLSVNLEMLASVIENSSVDRSPIASLEGRSCFLLKRKIIGVVGFLSDQRSVETDELMREYCFRMKENGFLTRLVTNCIVSIRQEDGIKDIPNPDVREIIEGIQQNISLPVDVTALFDKSILFLIPSHGGSGGAHCVVEQVIGLRDCGVNAYIAVQEIYSNNFLFHHPAVKNLLYIYSEEGPGLSALASKFDIVIATNYNSVNHLKEMLKANPDIVPMYYVQDYEVWFFPTRDLKRPVEAARSYKLIPNIKCFAYSQWLCEVINSWQGIEVAKIAPSLDKGIFHCYGVRSRNGTEPIRITAMIRPNSIVRAPEETLRVLKTIKNKYKNKVDIRVFGCTDEELDDINEAQGFHFINVGRLTRQQVAQLLGGCDIFIDASSYQAFGCTGLEAMAMGCATILPRDCGTGEYAINEINCLLVDTEKPEEIVLALGRYVENKAFLEKIKGEGIKTAREYSVRKAVWSEILLFNHVLSSVISRG